MQTLPQFIATALREPRDYAFAERLGSPEWRFTSSTRMIGRAGAIARALRAAGIENGDRVALIANNRIDWIAADFGILFANAVVVPVFSTLALDQMDYIFVDSAAKLAFVETAAEAERIRAACPNAPRLITFDGSGPDSLAAFEGSPDASFVPDATVDPESLAVLIYTSGTTGDPKGVMLSHRNLVTNATAASELLPDVLAKSDEPVLSVLPFAHIYEHTTIFIFALNRWRVYITSPEHLLEDLKSVRPRLMNLVPRIFERVLAGIQTRVKAEGGVKAKLVPWALEVGREYAAATQRGAKARGMLPLQFAIAQRLALSKIKPQIGLDRLEFFTSGSAPLHRDIMLTFAGMGVTIAEGYGLTETSPIVSSNPASAIRYGTVGRPIPGVEVKIAADGEILVKGPNVMRGYYKLPDERPFTPDGWFRTGDIGELDVDGYLSITDRKKELIKTSGGKYVAPGRVESALKRSIYVSQCFVIGDGRPFPIALVVPNWDLVRAELEISPAVSTDDISKRGDVRDLMTREVVEKTADLASFESIRRIAILPRELNDRRRRTLTHAQSKTPRRRERIRRSHRCGIRGSCRVASVTPEKGTARAADRRTDRTGRRAFRHVSDRRSRTSARVLRVTVRSPRRYVRERVLRGVRIAGRRGVRHRARARPAARAHRRRDVRREGRGGRDRTRRSPRRFAAREIRRRYLHVGLVHGSRRQSVRGSPAHVRRETAGPAAQRRADGCVRMRAAELLGRPRSNGLCLRRVKRGVRYRGRGCIRWAEGADEVARLTAYHDAARVRELAEALDTMMATHAARAGAAEAERR